MAKNAEIVQGAKDDALAHVMMEDRKMQNTHKIGTTLKLVRY